MFPIEHEWILVFGDKPKDLIPTVPNDSAGSAGGSSNRQANGKTTPILNAKPIRSHRELGTVVSVPPVKSNVDHPAQFPVGLAAAYIKSFTGDVYDPFLGSGTTIIAAEQLHRRCFGLEISPAYCDVIVARWEKFTGRKATLSDSA
jgi:DNA modification methylase